MQILTVEDEEFPTLLMAFSEGKRVGSYIKEGKVQIVRACPQFVFVSHDMPPQKIAMKPVRSFEEALRYAHRLLEKERERGSTVSLDQQE